MKKIPEELSFFRLQWRNFLYTPGQQTSHCNESLLPGASFYFCGSIAINTIKKTGNLKRIRVYPGKFVTMSYDGGGGKIK